jgi:hypothetical protein
MLMLALIAVVNVLVIRIMLDGPINGTEKMALVLSVIYESVMGGFMS